MLTLSLDALMLDDQPREIIPEEELRRLVATRAAHPPALLQALKACAADESYYREILNRLQDLSQSIATEGVLQPIQVARGDGGYVVRDGHRRCLASLLAGKTTVPGVLVDEPSEVEAVARALIVNLQREDLTALEKGSALLRLALLVARREGTETPDQEGSITLESLLGPAASDDAPAGEVSTTVTGHSRALAGRTRERVCAMLGLPPRGYYRLLALNRLDPRVRPLARGLTENQLRPIVGLAVEDQYEVASFAIKRGLSAREIGSLASVARSGDRDAVRRVMARLAKEDGTRQRTAVSWEPLLHAVPKDLWRRCQSLRSELEALPPPQRHARLDALWEQDRLLHSLREEFHQIFADHGYAGPSTLIEEDP